MLRVPKGGLSHKLLIWRIDNGRDHEHYYYDIPDNHIIIQNDLNMYILADDNEYPLAS